ncbi:hypothetical protein JCM6292_1160 [Bacteroides pyogenes JCM 6292]|uniref:Uncharacterized protein n=2 Tax=Bacteroides pyogenes TaxID=310300 RepID=W4PHJ1_9BACE|nr:hypothetical protein JCM6292_1160 [Bacteroides pyogenes JCM 6292]GAE18609.1 hypothetical protein JCM6294_1530 [Bacteroides pyogenes DSM 20611 = JCM 6294]
MRHSFYTQSSARLHGRLIAERSPPLSEHGRETIQIYAEKAEKRKSLRLIRFRRNSRSPA